MKLLKLSCPNCGAELQNNIENGKIRCKYCNTEFLLDNEVTHVKYDNPNEAGYEFEKGRIRAQQEERERQYEHVYYEVHSKRNKSSEQLTWWILGWIFCFPIPLTIVIAKSKKLNKKQKTIWISFLWIFLIIFSQIVNH